MPIFKIESNKAKKIKVSSFKREKDLQNLIEGNLEEIFGIKFLATEFQTGAKHGGRIDTLGIDENNSPVIIEYKWGEKDNVINQGLFYLDWIMDHKGDFEILVADKLGKRVAVDWAEPRVILIASSYNRYDTYALNRIAENIELWVYSLHEDGILEISSIGASHTNTKKSGKPLAIQAKSSKVVSDHLQKTVKDLQDKFLEIREKVLELQSVEEKTAQKTGITYRTSKSFARFEFRRNSIDLLLRAPKYIDPKNLMRDVTSFDWGFKGLVKITAASEMDYVFTLLKQSYEETL
jgi:predicted transport protein